MRGQCPSLVTGLVPIVLGLILPRLVWAQAFLENPQSGSLQSGIGMVSGWVCNAQRVDIVFDDGTRAQAAYGTSREDTRPVCGDANNGFGLLLNWNLAGDGVHTVRALADGVEFARATFTVTTLGAEFLRGTSGSFQLFGFPQAGADVSIRWQESMQNFTIEAVQVNSLAAQFASGKVMWIGAHPDDEGIVSPLLGDVCVEKNAPCTFLVATRGEAAPCKLPGGCLPDLATVRTREMRAAAALFGATLVQWELADGAAQTPEAVLNAWANSVGGETALLDRMIEAIEAAAPDVIITLDPRHGSTCHPDHRAVAALTLAALERLHARAPAAYLQGLGGRVPAAYLAESRIRFNQDGLITSFSAAVPGDPQLTAYDATQRLARVNDSAWEYLLRDARVHPSQFDPPALNALAAIPAETRRVFLLSLVNGSAARDSRYDSLCGS